MFQSYCYLNVQALWYLTNLIFLVEQKANRAHHLKHSYLNCFVHFSLDLLPLVPDRKKMFVCQFKLAEEFEGKESCHEAEKQNTELVQNRVKTLLGDM